jgi:hypothetical protein
VLACPFGKRNCFIVVSTLVTYLPCGWWLPAGLALDSAHWLETCVQGKSWFFLVLFYFICLKLWSYGSGFGSDIVDVLHVTNHFTMCVA